MKSLHFCTPTLVKFIKNHNHTLGTIRTGFIPNVYPGDIVKANWRRYEEEWNYKSKQIKPDTFLCYIKIQSVTPKLYRQLDQMWHHEELTRYHRKFHRETWFFLIEFYEYVNCYPPFNGKPIKNPQKTLF